jgi:hypothetical protein
LLSSRLWCVFPKYRRFLERTQSPPQHTSKQAGTMLSPFLCTILTLTVAATPAPAEAGQRGSGTVSYTKRSFVINGKPEILLSGAIHCEPIRTVHTCRWISKFAFPVQQSPPATDSSAAVWLVRFSVAHVVAELLRTTPLPQCTLI